MKNYEAYNYTLTKHSTNSLSILPIAPAKGAIIKVVCNGTEHSAGLQWKARVQF